MTKGGMVAQMLTPGRGGPVYFVTLEKYMQVLVILGRASMPHFHLLVISMY